MHLPALLCSLPVALMGAYYLVNAGAINWLGALEGSSINRIRVRLRRINGLMMLMMSLALYLGVSRVFGLGPDERVASVAPVAWIAVLPLLLIMVGLAWLDMRLTRRLKRDLIRKAAMDKNPNDRSNRNLAGTAVRGLAMVIASMTAVAGCDDIEASQAQPSTQQATSRPTTRAADLPRPGEEDPQQLRTIEMRVGEGTFILQVADTEEERQAGLMFRRSLAENEGMIFVYPEEDWLSFWMMNTFIPLDIAFLDEDGRVVNVAQMAAHDLRGTPSTAPAKYVIELPLGTIRKIELKPGMRLRIPEEAREAADPPAEQLEE